jgi:hypothetical protein
VRLAVTVAEGATTPGAPVSAVATDDGTITVFVADPGGGVFSVAGRHDNWGTWDDVAEGASGPGSPIATVLTPTLLGLRTTLTMVLADPGGLVYARSRTL